MRHYVLIATLCVFIGMVSVVNAQEKSATEKTGTADAAAKESAPKLYGPLYQLELKDQASNPVFKEMVVTKKFARRLPNFYKDTISEEQKEEIYAIQSTYFNAVEMLTIRLEKLKAERDAQIEAVLTQEQKAEIEKLNKASSEKRAANRKK